MSRYNDPELDRLLADADELLANITLYETPDEERLRKKREQEEAEARRLEEERLAAAEAARKAQEEARRLAEQEASAAQEQVEEPEEVEEKPEPVVEKPVEVEEKPEPVVEKPVEVEEKPEPVVEENGPSPFLMALIFNAVSFVFMEVLTHVGIFKGISTQIMYPVLFAVALGCFVTLLTTILPKQVNCVIAIGIMFLFGAYCDIQILFHSVTGSVLRLSHLPQDFRGMVQSGVLGQAAIKNIPWLIFMFVPVIIWIVIFRDIVTYERISFIERLITVIAMVLVTVVCILTLDIHGYDQGSPYVSFYHYREQTNLENCEKQLGVFMNSVMEAIYNK